VASRSRRRRLAVRARPPGQLAAQSTVLLSPSSKLTAGEKPRSRCAASESAHVRRTPPRRPTVGTRGVQQATEDLNSSSSVCSRRRRCRRVPARWASAAAASLRRPGGGSVRHRGRRPAVAAQGVDEQRTAPAFCEPGS
jgi:hypothetical protein